MSATLSTSIRRVSSLPAPARPISHQQCRHASLIRRPKRPYTFTQLIALSDGSTFIHRTTSPIAVVKSNKDIKNSPLWNPSSQKLLNVEEDEAGRLRAFRARFGRGWDAEVTSENEEAREGEDALGPQEAEESLLDLISGYGREAESKGEAKGTREENSKAGKGAAKVSKSRVP